MDEKRKNWIKNVAKESVEELLAKTEIDRILNNRENCYDYARLEGTIERRRHVGLFEDKQNTAFLTAIEYANIVQKGYSYGIREALAISKSLLSRFESVDKEIHYLFDLLCEKNR